MRWFKLPTDDYASNHINELVVSLGLEGLARWYLLCQLHYSNLEKNGDESEISACVLRRILRIQTASKLHSFLTQVELKSLLSVTQVGLKYRLKIVKYFKSNKTKPESIEYRDKSLEVRDKSTKSIYVQNEDFGHRDARAPNQIKVQENEPEQIEFLEPIVEYDDPPPPDDFPQLDFIQKTPKVKLRAVPRLIEPGKGDFNTFWEKYPRKDKKAKALKIWLKLKPSLALLETILKDLDRKIDSHSWQKSNGDFIPLPTTYLNDRAWEDKGVTVRDWKAAFIAEHA